MLFCVVTGHIVGTIKVMTKDEPGVTLVGGSVLLLVTLLALLR